MICLKTGTGAPYSACRRAGVREPPFPQNRLGSVLAGLRRAPNDQEEAKG